MSDTLIHSRFACLHNPSSTIPVGTCLYRLNISLPLGTIYTRLNISSPLETIYTEITSLIIRISKYKDYVEPNF